MKYASTSLLARPAKPVVEGPDFRIETVTQFGADKMVEELNRLDLEKVQLGAKIDNQREELEAVKRDLKLQIDAKNNYISQAATFITAIRKSQQVLAAYLPTGGTSPGATLNSLLEILDNGDLVNLVRGSVLGASEDGDVANGSKKFLDVGDEATVILKRGEDGKQYIAGPGIGPFPPFTVQADQVYVNKRLVLDGITPTMGLVAEPTERVVNNTTNHFASRKVSKKQLDALQYAIDKMVDPTTRKSLCKLLKKLS